MELNELIKRTNDIKPGVYTKIKYKSAVKTDRYHKDIQITKVTNAVCRLGVNYGHISAVQKKFADGERNHSTRENNFEYVSRCVKHNTNTGKYSLEVATTPNTNHRYKVMYHITDANGNTKVTDRKEDIREYVTDSVYNGSHSGAEIYTIGIDNVISVGA